MISYSMQNKRLIKYFKIEEWMFLTNPMNQNILFYPSNAIEKNLSKLKIKFVTAASKMIKT